MSPPDQVSQEAAAIAESVDRLVQLAQPLLREGRAGEIVPDAAVQGLLALATRLYTAKLQAEQQIPPFPPDAVTATDVVMTVSEMLRAVDVELFELGMWQAWGRP